MRSTWARREPGGAFAMAAAGATTGASRAAQVDFEALRPMPRRAVLVLVLVFAVFVPRAPASPISRVVVLMMENHSFDNLLGWLPGVGDLTGEECAAPPDSDLRSDVTDTISWIRPIRPRRRSRWARGRRSALIPIPTTTLSTLARRYTTHSRCGKRSALMTVSRCPRTVQANPLWADSCTTTSPSMARRRPS